MRRTKLFAAVVWTSGLASTAIAAEPAKAPAPTQAPAPAAVEAEPPHPREIAMKMTNVVGDLAKTQTGEPVQTQQKVILGDLDALIASLEKACSECKGGRVRNNPKKPASDSRLRTGTGGIGDLTDPGQSEKDWAKLSPRERDRILQSMSEGFPPEYRTVLERYYRRLADEKAAPAPGAVAKAAKDDEADAVPDKK